jgi:TAP-like protein
MGMESHVLRYQGGGHILLSRSELTCVADAVDAYLFTLQLPNPDARCAAKPIAFGAAAVQAARQDGALQMKIDGVMPRLLR